MVLDLLWRIGFLTSTSSSLSDNNPVSGKLGVDSMASQYLKAWTRMFMSVPLVLEVEVLLHVDDVDDVMLLVLLEQLQSSHRLNCIGLCPALEVDGAALQVESTMCSRLVDWCSLKAVKASVCRERKETQGVRRGLVAQRETMA
ncbi:unnamed protein product [Boreogadus saida]